MKLKKGDNVKIVRGKDKGKTGKIDRVFPKHGMVVVPGVNQYKRHLKARSANKPSEIITLTKPLPLANVQLVCPKCNLPTRVGMQGDGGNKKVRVCRKCGQAI